MANLQEISQELWADIKGYEGLYQVSTKSNIRSLSKVRVIKNIKQIYPMRNLKQSKMNNGYFTVSLWKGEVKNSFLVHRVVAENFISNPLNLEQVNHKNGIKADNSIENLEWCTRSENMIHAIKTGLIKRKAA